jgi:glycosyltransferase involved in cell wall biosynthesis
MTSTLSNIPFSFTAHAFGVHRSTPSALRRKCEAAAFVRATHRSFGDRLPNAIHIPTPLLLDELPFKAPHTPGSALQVVTVARLVPKKGIDLLPALRDQLRKAGISAEFTVIGPGDTAAYQAPGIRCRGPLSHQEALKSIQEADLYLQPCRIAPDGDRDGLPVSLLEAFALGTPSVATRVAGIPELFPDALSHQLAPADNVDALAQIMTGLWARPQRWAEIARSQRSVVEQRFGPCAVDALIGRFERHRCG